MVEHFIEMMAGSLRLREPWFVESAKFDAENQRVDIYVAVRPEAEFACPECGGKTSRYGYEPQERLWRHADCMFYPTYVHCRRPRVVCPKCGVRQVSAPFERKNSRHTTYFEGYAMMLLADMPRAAAARALHVTLMIDADARCVVDVEEGRDKEAVASFYRSATPKDAESASRRVANTSSTHEESRFPTNFGVEPVYNKTII